MELKNCKDLVDAFIATGDKYGYFSDEYLYDAKNKIDTYSKFSELPEDNKEYYIRATCVFGDHKSWIEHVTTGWDPSYEEPYTLDKPYDVNRVDTEYTKTYPVFAWFVKPSKIVNGEITHIVTDISGILTQYNEFYMDSFIHDNVVNTKRTCKNDICIETGTVSEYHDAGEKQYSGVQGVFLKNKKIYVNYRSYDVGNKAYEISFPEGWKVFTTYEEVLNYQKSEEKRISSDVNNVAALEAEIKANFVAIENIYNQNIKLLEQYEAAGGFNPNIVIGEIRDAVKAFKDFDIHAYAWRRYM